MDKKIASGIDISRRGAHTISKDSNNDGRNIKICNRLGCSTRHDSSLRGLHTSKSEKLKCPKDIQPRSKCAVSSSSEPVSSSNNCRKPKEQDESHDSQPNSVVSESSRRQELTGSSNSRAVTGKAKLTSKSTKNGVADRRRKKPESDSFVGTSDDATEISGSTILNAHSASQNQTHRWILSRNRGASSRSPLQHGITAGCSTFQPISHSHRRSTNLQRCKDKVGSSKEESSLFPRATSPSLRDNPVSQPATYRTRYGPIIDDDQNNSRRVRNREVQQNLMNTDDSIYSISEQPFTEEVPQTQTSSGEVEVIRQSLLSLTEISPSTPASSSEAAPIPQSLRTRQISRLDDRARREPARTISERDAYHNQTMDGIREVLLALDRIDQDTDLSHEHLLLLETSLLLGSLGIPDQHRDMRLDIDNMSYEELLALGEKMGTVNTALTEEALLKCLKRSIYGPNSLISVTTEDAKCSICQEEYVIGEEIGKLACEHFYHYACISQWFQLKNWCPICKASASPS